MNKILIHALYMSLCNNKFKLKDFYYQVKEIVNIVKPKNNTGIDFIKKYNNNILP